MVIHNDFRSIHQMMMANSFRKRKYSISAIEKRHIRQMLFQNIENLIS
jgi:hypothetical protein